MSVPRTLTATSAALVGLLALAGCTSGGSAEPEKTEPAAATVTIEDNTGTHEIATPPTSVVTLDNRTFQTLSDWDVELSAGAVALMPETVSYVKDDAIVDIGLHSEPDLEAVVAVEPDLIISGQRFTQHNAAIADLVPDATIVDLEPREGEPFGASSSARSPSSARSSASRAKPRSSWTTSTPLSSAPRRRTTMPTPSWP